MDKKYTTQLKQFGLRLKELRNEDSLTQAELSERVGINKRTLQRIEAGEIAAGLNTVIGLATAFNIGLSELLKDINLTPSKK